MRSNGRNIGGHLTYFSSGRSAISQSSVVYELILASTFIDTPIAELAVNRIF